MTLFALYVHWPFCISKCPYCDFNSHVRQEIDENQWVQAYLRELKYLRDKTGPRVLTSLFFGGGTPSLMAPSTVEAILTAANKLWGFCDSPEITLEANPNSVEVGKFKQLAQVGINRVSLGIQSFKAEDLNFLGRAHTVSEGKRAIAVAQETFTRVSFDLIYARPRQTLSDWKEELTEALSLGTDHLSLYQLTIEPGTAFYHRYQRGEFSLPPEELAIDLYNYTLTACTIGGLENYEVSNFAKPGRASRHNLTYWRYGDYIGVGPGAHGRLTLETKKVATRQFKAPQTWLTQALSPTKATLSPATQEVLPLTPKEQAEESLLMGLRLREPFPFNRLPLPLPQILNFEGLEKLKKLNLLDFDEQYVTLKPSGFLCVNEVLRHIIL